MANQHKKSFDEQPELRAKLAKEGRLWGLAVICAAFGAIAIWRFDSLMVGIGVFALALLILGTALYNYEKRRGSGDSES